MQSTNIKPPLWTKNFVLLSISNLFLFMSFQMLIPTLPVYVTHYGGDDRAVGLVIGVFTVSALIARPYTGSALDAFGRRKMLLMGISLFFLCVIGYYWAATVLLILTVRFIHGVGWGMATTTFGTIASDLIPKDRRGEGMGYFGLAGNFAMATGPFVGIWLIGRYSFTILFLVSAIFSMLALVLSQFLKLEEQLRRDTSTPSRKPSILERRAFFPSLLAFFLSFTYGGIVSFITLFGQEEGLANVGLFFVANAVMIMAIRPFAGILFDQKGPAWILVPGMLFTLIGLFLLSYTKSTSMLIVSAALYGAGFGAIQPSLQAWTIHRVPVERRGAANGTFYSAFDLGIGAGAMILGWVAGWTGYSTMYRWSMLSMVFYAIFYIYYLMKFSKKDESEQVA